MSFNLRLVYVTAPSLGEARLLAEKILEKKLAACVQLIPGVESHYWWEGKKETAQEILLLMKSSAEQFESLAMEIRAHHSYTCPEIVAVTPAEIEPDYRSWWEKESTGGII